MRKILAVLLGLTLSAFAQEVSDLHVPRNIQSPYVAADFWTQWGSVNPRMALFIKITSKADFGSAVIAFTSNTRDMTMPGHVGVTFKSAPGITPTTIEMALDNPINLEMTGIYQSSSFTHEDVTAGKWSFAEVEIFSACWDDGTESGGVDKRKYGEFLHGKVNLGEFKDYQSHFTAEGRGKAALLSQNVDVVTTRFCRAPVFGDLVYCRKDLTGTVTIDSVAYNITQTGIHADGSWTNENEHIVVFESDFTGNLPPDDFYKNGTITCTAGANAGVAREMAGNYDIGAGDMSIILKRFFPFPVAHDDTFTLVTGCDRTIEMCVLYENIVNRRAEDWIPGIESVNRIPPAN